MCNYKVNKLYDIFICIPHKHIAHIDSRSLCIRVFSACIHNNANIYYAFIYFSLTNKPLPNTQTFLYF